MLEIFDELMHKQQEKLLQCARCIIPTVTTDDLLQPNDFPELENHPYFRYEEGVLEGILTARMAYLASQQEDKKEREKHDSVMLPSCEHEEKTCL